MAIRRIYQNIILASICFYHVHITLAQSIVDQITDTVTGLIPDDGAEDTEAADLLSSLTGSCTASTRSDMNRFGIEHNVALDATGIVLGEDLPTDMDGYVLIVKDQAKLICDGEQVCLEGLDLFTIEALNYVYRQEEEHYDFTVNESINVEKKDTRTGGGRRLTDVLPENDLSERVLGVLETVIDNIALDTEEDIIRALNSLEKEVREEEHPDRALNTDEQVLVNAAISVAKASTTYWQKAFREESNHFRRLQGGKLLDCAIAGQPGLPEDEDDDSKGDRNLRGTNKRKRKLGKKPTKGRRTKAKKKKYHPTKYYWDDYLYDDWYYDDYYNFGWDPCGKCFSFQECERCYQQNGYGAGSYMNANGGYFDGGKYNYGGRVGGSPGYYGGNFVNGGRQGYNHGGQVGRRPNPGMGYYGNYYGNNSGRPNKSPGRYYGYGNNSGRPKPYYGYNGGRPTPYYGYNGGRPQKGKGKGTGGYYGLQGWMEFNDDYYMQLVPEKSASKSVDAPSQDLPGSFFEAVAGFGLNTFFVVRADVVGVVIGLIVGRGCVLPAAASAFLFSALYAVCYRDPSIGFTGFLGN